VRDFLEKFHPNGLWVLTAIAPTDKGIETKTFDASAADAADEWIKRWNRKRNLYFHVNQPRHALTSKARKEDIAEVRYLHVDIDARVGEERRDELARIKKLLTSDLPSGVPKPTFIVFSGGGYQAFWRLSEPIVVNGDVEKADAAARFNEALESALGADRCHNVDRIMRLPGTWNLPNAKKLKRGRTEVQAELYDFDLERVYDLSNFTPATPNGNGNGRGATPAPIGVARRLAADEFNDLRIDDRTRAIIVQGRLPDEVILGIITDRDLAISESVLDKGANAEKYAKRQIERAHEKVDAELDAEPEGVAPRRWRRYLNHHHAVIDDMGGKCRVISWREAFDRSVLYQQSFADFRNRYMNRRVVVGQDKGGDNVLGPVGKWWLECRDRRQFNQVVFDPARGREFDGNLNLWRGFGVEPVEGDWSLMRQHIEEVLAAGDPETAAYILRWSAWAVQNPEKRAEVVLGFRGGQGTGKGTFARAMCDLFGQHSLHLSSMDQMVGRFNVHFRDCALLFADEAIAPNDKSAVGRLKHLVTEPTLMIEPKGVDREAVPNRLKILMASNDAWMVPADADDRRFVVLDVSPCRCGDSTWFKALHAQMHDRGLAAMLHDLRNMDLGDWHPRKDRPETAAMVEQKIDSLRGMERAWFECLHSGELPMGDRVEGFGSVLVPSTALVDWARDRLRNPYLNTNHLSALLGQPQANDRSAQRGMGFEKKKQRNRWHWEIPSLRVARERWNAMRFEVEWEEADEWYAPPVPF
jgi:hypothetical protein